MSTPILIIGVSGTGKSTSMRNFNPADVLLIQIIPKKLPFPGARQWKVYNKETAPDGNTMVTEDSDVIMKLMRGTRRKVIVIDDFQYMLANEFMNRSAETGFQKFTDIGKHAWEVIGAASRLDAEKRVYFLSHSDEADDGRTKMKTIGKLLDEKISPEGMFTIVLKTIVDGDKYFFSTRNSGSDVVKAPMGLFDDTRIDNDLAAVDAAICGYYGIETPHAQEAA
jgi:hypothetical protein